MLRGSYQRAGGLAFGEEAVDFTADSAEIVEVQVDNGVADVGDLVELFQAFDDHVTDDAGGDFSAAYALQGGFNLADEAVDVGGRDRALGAGDADAAHELFSIELFARAIRFDYKGNGKNGAFVRTEALVAVVAFTAAADTAVAVVGGIEDFRFFILAVRATHEEPPDAVG